MRTTNQIVSTALYRLEMTPIVNGREKRLDILMDMATDITVDAYIDLERKNRSLRRMCGCMAIVIMALLCCLVSRGL